MPSISPSVLPLPRSSGATTGSSASARSRRNACSSRIASRDHRPGRWNFTTSLRSSSSSTSYTRFSKARRGRQRPVERRPPTSTASRTRLGVRAKNEAVRSLATIGTIIPHRKERHHDLRDPYLPYRPGQPRRGREALRGGLRVPQEVLGAHRLPAHGDRAIERDRPHLALPGSGRARTDPRRGGQGAELATEAF